MEKMHHICDPSHLTILRLVLVCFLFPCKIDLPSLFSIRVTLSASHNGKTEEVHPSETRMVCNILRALHIHPSTHPSFLNNNFQFITFGNIHKCLKMPFYTTLLMVHWPVSDVSNTLRTFSTFSVTTIFSGTAL